MTGEQAKKLNNESKLNAENTPCSGLFVRNFKPYLKTGLSTKNQPQELQPIGKWSEKNSFDIKWLQEILQLFFASLKTAKFQTSEQFNYKTYATGLERKQFKIASSELAAIIVSCPNSWPDSYRFNLREEQY